MKAVKLELDHYKILDARFRDLQTCLSNYSFANLYLFRKIHAIEVIMEEEIFIRGIARDGKSFLMLTNRPEERILNRASPFLEEVDFLFPIPTVWLSYFDFYHARGTLLEEESDYLYDLSVIETYPGRHLSKKRNLVKQLLNEHTVESRPFVFQDQEGALQVLNAWQEASQKDQSETDFFSCEEGILLRDHLKLEGTVALIDGTLQGFVLGAWVSNETFVILFAKAGKNIHGIYPYLYQQLAQQLHGRCRLLNMEENLGSMALKQAKHSYQPVKMGHKWRIKLVPLSQ